MKNLDISPKIDESWDCCKSRSIFSQVCFFLVEGEARWPLTVTVTRACGVPRVVVPWVPKAILSRDCPIVWETTWTISTRNHVPDQFPNQLEDKDFMCCCRVHNENKTQSCRKPNTFNFVKHISFLPHCTTTNHHFPDLFSTDIWCIICVLENSKPHCCEFIS